MRYAVISDVHANEEALRRVLADIATQHVGRIVCLGDVVGYGPMPAAALSLVRASAAVTLAGNHDDAVSGRLDPKDFVDLAGEAVSRHRAALSAADLAWLRARPYTCQFGGAVAAHGDVADPKKFYYVEEASDAEANFAATEARLVFVGHTHVPCVFVTGASGKVHRLEPQDFALEEGKRYIVNPGSVGYPRERNGACHSTYVIYDDETGSVVFRSLPFSVASVMQRGKATARGRRMGLAAGVLVAVAVFTGIAFHLMAPKGTVTVEKRVEISRTVEPFEDPSLCLSAKSLTLARACRKVRANLEIEGGVVQLWIRFRDAGGGQVGREGPHQVKKTNRKAYTIPAGSVTADFTVTRQSPESAARIVRFEPSAEMAAGSERRREKR